MCCGGRGFSFLSIKVINANHNVISLTASPSVVRSFLQPPGNSSTGAHANERRGLRRHRFGLLPSATARRTLHRTIARLTLQAPTLRVADSVTLVWPEASSSVLEYGVWHGLLPTAPDQLKRYHSPGAQSFGENLLEVGGLEPGTECTLCHDLKPATSSSCAAAADSRPRTAPVAAQICSWCACGRRTAGTSTRRR